MSFDARKLVAWMSARLVLEAVYYCCVDAYAGGAMLFFGYLIMNVITTEIVFLEGWFAIICRSLLGSLVYKAWLPSRQGGG